ncbi:MAG: hypothetical protein JXA53_07720 [Bacteroidales bacterium]|nr:hypothetical protein [Bacteroidales bacterium]
MICTEEYEAKKALIESLPDDQIKTPYMPLDTFIGDAETVTITAKNDESKLLPLGLKAELLTDMPLRIGALRHLQARWKNECQNSSAAQEEWSIKSAMADELLTELFTTFRFAYRKNPTMLKAIAEIAEGNTNTDKIQDLYELALLGKNNAEPLTAIGFDITKLDTAGDFANELGELLARVNGEKGDLNSLKVMRDKAYTLLKEGVDEIRTIGKFAFWKDERHQAKYLVHYFVKKRKTIKETAIEEEK